MAGFKLIFHWPFLLFLLLMTPPDLVGLEQPRPVRALVLLGEWFGDAYFPLQKEMEARGWTQKRVGVEAEYRGCYKKTRDVVLTSEILIPDLKDFSAFDVLIIPSGPQFRKFKENPAVLEFLRKAHASGMLIASFCVGNFLIQAADLIPEGAALFPEKVTKVKEGLLLGPRGGGPPPGDGFMSAPIKELCDAIASELEGSKAKAAIVTFVSNHEQERAVKALVKSVRELSGAYRASKIFVVTTDEKELGCAALKQEGVEVLSLEIEPAFLSYPLALKAFAAAQVEKKVGVGVDTLIWLDPGVIVLNSLGDLDLGKDFDAALRPVTLANTIGIAPGSEPNDYWRPLYGETGLDCTKLPVLRTIIDDREILPYYNCEVFSFNPKLGLAREWARLLARFLKDDTYQKTVCTTFLRKLFLHQAVLSAVISSRLKPERIRPLPLTSGYPFSQHEKLPAAKKSSSLNGVSVVIFDRTWPLNPAWMNKVTIEEPLHGWLLAAYVNYLEIAPQIYRVEGSCNSYLVVTKAGSVLIDPAGAAVAPQYFQLILEKHPLQAILLTHAHPDHSDDMERWKGKTEIPVVAQREFKRYFEYVGELQGFFARRNAIWAGKSPSAAQPEQPEPQQRPTVYYGDAHELEIGGLHFKMLHTPGETPDHATIWLPELKAVFVGDNYYEYFINNSTFRGTMIRPVLGYIRALDTALAFDPEYFLMGHGMPLVSGEEVKQTAVNFRDALKYVYDQTIQGINAGKDMHTLMHEIKLPDKYAIPQFYGKVEWTVRGIWQEYVGWFDENPASMYAIPVSSVYADLSELAGAEKLLRKSEAYMRQGEYPRTLHLTEIVLKSDPRHPRANEIRIKALNALKSGTSNFIEKIWLNHAIRICEENLSSPASSQGQ